MSNGARSVRSPGTAVTAISSKFIHVLARSEVELKSTRTMAEKTLSGGCACGDITFTSTAPPQHLDYCYCLTCQQMSGAPFVAWTGVPKGDLKINLTSRPIVYSPKIGDTDICVSRRICCGTCGCNVILQYDLYPEKTHIAASTIRHCDFEMPSVGCHIWTRHVPSWHKLPEDGVQQYIENDPTFQARLDEHLEDLQLIPKYARST